MDEECAGGRDEQMEVKEWKEKDADDAEWNCRIVYYTTFYPVGSFDYDEIIITKSVDNYSDCVANINGNSMMERWIICG